MSIVFKASAGPTQATTVPELVHVFRLSWEMSAPFVFLSVSFPTYLAVWVHVSAQ